MPLASVARAAKPTTRPSTAEDASTPVATRRTESNCHAASARPMITISAKMRRRTSLRRVVATGESSPPRTRSPTLWPRRASARSTISAITKARTTVTIAVIQLLFSSMNEAAV